MAEKDAVCKCVICIDIRWAFVCKTSKTPNLDRLEVPTTTALIHLATYSRKQSAPIGCELLNHCGFAAFSLACRISPRICCAFSLWDVGSKKPTSPRRRCRRHAGARTRSCPPTRWA